MLFQPKKPDNMWDCTVIEENGLCHIFYLCGGALGHISTKDFVKFTEHKKLAFPGGNGSWNGAGLILTGCIVKTAENEFKMLCGSLDGKSKQQVYGLFTSENLIDWQEYGSNPVLKADGKIYSDIPSERDWFMHTAWRDPQLYCVKDGWYYLCLCARRVNFEPDSTGSCIASVRTRDFINFEYLEPLADTGKLVKYAECPDCFDLNGNKYVTFLDHAWGGQRSIDTSARKGAAGTFYMRYDEALQKFITPDDFLLAGSANNRQCAWAARTYTDNKNKRVLYHHITAPRPSLALPKEIKASDSGDLTLELYPSLSNYSGKKTAVAQKETIPCDNGKWTQNQDIFYGENYIYASALPVGQTSAAIIDCDITVSRGKKAGLALWHDKTDGKAVCVYLDFENSAIAAELLYYRTCEGFGLACGDIVNGGAEREFDYKKLPLEYGKTYNVCVFCRNQNIEVFIDGVWALCKHFKTAKKSGGLLLTLEQASADFKLKVNKMKDITVKT